MFRSIRRALALAILLTAVIAVAPVARPALQANSARSSAVASQMASLWRSSWGTLSMNLMASADAHRIDSRRAEQIVADAYRSHCGNGFLWWCDQYPSHVYSEPLGFHSWKVELRWTEGRLNRVRNCGVTRKVKHDALNRVIVNEWCVWR